VGKYPVAAPAPVVTKGWTEYLFVHRQRSLGTPNRSAGRLSQSGFYLGRISTKNPADLPASRVS